MHREDGQKIPLIQLAPMEGVLDWVLREMLSEIGGLDRLVTEFVRVTDKVLPDHVFLKYAPELECGGRSQTGVPVFVQLLGSRPEFMAANAVKAVELGALGIDLNFGCPAKTVNRHDGGAVLLKHPERVFSVVQAVRQAVSSDVPVTAKVRLGFDVKDLHREIAAAVDEGGASHLVVHARTKAEMYQPPAHWEYIASMKEGRTLPFLANGEIWSVEDYQRCRVVSGCERVALGRGLVRRPTLAREIRFALASGGLQDELVFEPALFLEKFFERTQSYRGVVYAIARLKQMLRYWSAGEVRYQGWFQRGKMLSSLDQCREFLYSLRKDDEQWLQSRFIPPPVAPIVSVPSNF